MCANDKFSWPCSTASSRERITAIETIVQNFYGLIAHPYQEPYMIKNTEDVSGEPKVMQRTTKEPF